MNNKSILFFLLAVAVTAPTTTFAQNTFRLVIDQDKADAKIPVSAVCPGITDNFEIKKIGDEVEFADKKQRVKQVIDNGFLPKFDLKEIYAEGVFQISSSDSTKNCTFTVNAVPIGRTAEIPQKLEGSGKKELGGGPGWLFLEETPPTLEESLGTVTRIYEHEIGALAFRTPQ